MQVAVLYERMRKRWQGSPGGAAVFLSVLMIFTAADESMAMARQKDRPVIALSCPEQVPSSEVLCREMIQALARAMPDATIRPLQADDIFVPRVGDLALKLLVDDLSDSGMEGHLEWKTSTVWENGPTVRLSVMDRALSPRFFRQFADALIRETPQLPIRIRE